MTERMEHLTYKEMVRELELFSLDKRKVRVILPVRIYTDEGTEEDRIRLTGAQHRIGNRHQLKHNEFHLNNCPPPSFSSKVGQTPEQVAQGCCRVCVPEDIQNSTGDSPEQSVPLDPVLIRGNWKK